MSFVKHAYTYTIKPELRIVHLVGFPGTPRGQGECTLVDQPSLVLGGSLNLKYTT